MLDKKILFISNIILLMVSSLILSEQLLKSGKISEDTLGVSAPRRGLRWPVSSLPINIVAPNSMKNDIELSLKESCDEWNRGSERKLLTYSFEDYDPSKIQLKKERSGNHRLYFIKKWSSISNKEALLAQTFRERTGSILKNATIVFNGEYSFYFKRNSSSTIKPYQYDIKTILSHEIGHLLGLGHSLEFNSVMRDKIPEGLNSMTILDSDIKRVRSRYPF